jgi:hypothetical protein
VKKRKKINVSALGGETGNWGTLPTYTTYFTGYLTKFFNKSGRMFPALLSPYFFHLQGFFKIS